MRGCGLTRRRTSCCRPDKYMSDGLAVVASSAHTATQASNTAEASLPTPSPSTTRSHGRSCQASKPESRMAPAAHSHRLFDAGAADLGRYWMRPGRRLTRAARNACAGKTCCTQYESMPRGGALRGVAWSGRSYQRPPLDSNPRRHSPLAEGVIGIACLWALEAQGTNFTLTLARCIRAGSSFLGPL